MDFFHKKYKCEKDDEKFDTYADSIEHTRKIHHHPILKCNKCEKQFLHEKDRLHHVRRNTKKKWTQGFTKMNINMKKKQPPKRKVDSPQ